MLESMFSWVLSILESGGYAGIFILMVLENVFPPIPSELIIPLAGFAAAKGEMNIALVVLIATCGSVVGCLPWYFVGHYFGIARLERWSLRHGRLLTLSPQNIGTAQKWFKRYGYISVFAGRLIPAIRTLISLPAGIVRMPLMPFLTFSFFGSALWTSVLVLLGYALESQYAKASGLIELISNGVIMLIIAYYIYRVVTFDPKK